MLMPSGMLFCTSAMPGNAEAVPASGVAVWGSRESLRTETLLASLSPETPSSLAEAQVSGTFLEALH